MFTIKWVQVCGAESVWSAVSAYRASDLSPGPGYEQVSFDTDKGIHCTIDSGSVYIMNERGATVADWHLGRGPDRAKIGAEAEAVLGSMPEGSYTPLSSAA